MNSRKSLTMVLAALLIALILPAAALAQPAVSVECAYTDANVVCEAYVDTTGTGGLRSGGLQFNTANCTAVSAEKNTDVWFFGDAPPGFPYNNSPDLTDTKAPNLIVGQLDTNPSPTVVTGNRVKMGAITFSRDDATIPDIIAGLARGGGSFVSFVDASSGDSLDSTVVITTKVAERGDADGNGQISASDFTLVRELFFSGGYTVFADCDGSGSISAGDFTCLRNKFFGL